MNWDTIYRKKVTDVQTALSVIESNQRIYVGGGAGVPIQLINGLTERAPYVQNVEVTHILTFADAPYVNAEYADSFRHNALFIGHSVRAAVQDGRADFTPVFLSEIPELFRSGPLPLDVALISLSPPDEHGFCSFGIEVGTTKPAAEAARIIIAEINPQMPRTLGDSFIHVSRLDHIVEVDYSLPEAPQGGPLVCTSRSGKISLN
jgi:4-hydroxybutyrate CoA-transferase